MEIFLIIIVDFLAKNGQNGDFSYRTLLGIIFVTLWQLQVFLGLKIREEDGLLHKLRLQFQNICLSTHSEDFI